MALEPITTSIITPFHPFDPTVFAFSDPSSTPVSEFLPEQLLGTLGQAGDSGISTDLPLGATYSFDDDEEDEEDDEEDDDVDEEDEEDFDDDEEEDDDEDEDEDDEEEEEDEEYYDDEDDDDEEEEEDGEYDEDLPRTPRVRRTSSVN